MSQEFGFTVKVLGKEGVHAVPSDYQKVWDHWEKMGATIVFKNGEDDPRGVLHYHGIFSLPAGFYRKKLAIPGFHQHYDVLRNRNDWVKYCFKNPAIPQPKKLPVKCLFKVTIG